jgi:predicted porin
MQKKLIALAVVAAFSAPAFADNANFNLYGAANLSFDHIDSGTATNGTSGTSSNRIASNTSKFGFKGSDDLGDGLNAVYQVEQVLYMDGGSGNTATLATRNTYGGLAGGFGTVLLGRHDTPYKIATRNLDLFGDGIADNRSLMGATGSAYAAFDGRQPDVLAYISPAMGGFTGAIGYVNLNQALNVAENVSTSPKATALSVAGMYNEGPFFASVAYETHNLDTAVNAAGNRESATKFGFGFTQEMFTVGVAYEKTKDDFGGTSIGGKAAVAPKYDPITGLVTTPGTAATNNASAFGTDFYGHSAYYVAGKFKLSSTDAIKLAYTHKGVNTGAVNTGAKQITVGYDHGMSKRTTLYVLYSKLTNGTASNYGLSNNGTSATQATTAGAGASPAVVSLGMRHTF